MHNFYQFWPLIPLAFKEAFGSPGFVVLAISHSRVVLIFRYYTVGGMLMVEIFSIAKSFTLSKLFYLEEISIAKSFLIMNLSAAEDKMT